MVNIDGGTVPYTTLINYDKYRNLVSILASEGLLVYMF